MYLNSINYLRAIAIFLTVVNNSFGSAMFHAESIIGQVLYNLLAGGTSFFVFISGLLFHHIFYQGFNYKDFILKKIKYVFVPYLIISLPINTYFILFGKAPWTLYLPTGDGIIDLYFIPFLKYYLTGFHIISYWYIPFTMILFLLTPIFILFIRQQIKMQIILIIALLILASLIHRPDYNSYFDVIQAVLYFSPMYLIGIMSSIYRVKLLQFLKGKNFYFISLGVMLAILGVAFDQIGNQRKPPLEFDGFDLMIFQKFVLCFFFLSWLEQYENQQFKILNTIADNSFGIFFIHPIVILVFLKLKSLYIFSLPSNKFIIFFLIALTVFLISLLISIVVKKVFPNHSRFLIGS